MLHVSPTVPEVSDYSAGAGQHSEFENLFPGANAVGQTCLSHRTTVPVPSPTTQAPGTLVQSPAGAVGAGFGSWLPPGNVVSENLLFHICFHPWKSWAFIDVMRKGQCSSINVFGSVPVSIT